MILHSWQAQFWIKSGILALTIEIPFMAAMFLPLFLGPVLGVMMKQVCWHSRRSEAHRGLRPLLGCKTYCGGPFMRPCFLSVFEPHFRGHDEAVFGCKKSIHYQMSQHEQQVTSKLHQHKTTFKRLHQKAVPNETYTLVLQ